MKKLKIKLSIVFVAVVVTLMSLITTSCLSILTNMGMVFNNAMDTNSIQNREYYTGDANDLGVTFYNGKMYATWDATGSSDITLSVTDEKGTQTFNAENSTITDGSFCLSDVGYDYWNNINITLYYAESAVRTRTRGYNYKGINADTYDKYTKKVSAGFKEIDFYMGNRSEWFDFWSYLIIFREDYKIDQGCYDINAKVYMGYNYEKYYSTQDKQKAFTYEVYSAIDAYEDSAAYSYSCDVDSTGRYGTVYLKFSYDFDPKYTSDTAATYQNVTDRTDPAHYRTAASTEGKPRTFAIDSVTETIQVTSSDQLYFALKKGYRPVPVTGSNAYYLYEEMKRIMGTIVSDKDDEATKIHYIYDYLVNTVLYDYDFTGTIYRDEGYTTAQLFSYRSLYMEGVFGLTDDGVFDDGKKIAICDGLSKAFLSLATIEGIKTLKISGKVNDDGHAWNKVCINGIWYMVDTTWGNSLEQETGKEYLSHEYLLVPDDKSHNETEYITYPSANNRYYFGTDISNDSGSGSSRFIRPIFPTWTRNPRYAA